MLKLTVFLGTFIATLPLDKRLFKCEANVKTNSVSSTGNEPNIWAEKFKVPESI
jgi:hypothetical protein